MTATICEMRYWEFEEDVDSAVSVGLRLIGDLVREARLRRNLTQRQLAWSALLTQSTISRLETGRLQGIRLRTLAAILGVLHMNPKGTASAGWCRSGRGFPEPAAPGRRLPRQTRTGDVRSHSADAHRPGR
jgi:transcriptional regulator with XRE-family HTH domain